MFSWVCYLANSATKDFSFLVASALTSSLKSLSPRSLKLAFFEQERVVFAVEDDLRGYRLLWSEA